MQSIKGKVIAAFLLACATIGLAILITQFTFSELLITVDNITVPNEKLQKLNAFYHRVTQLDQKQRAEAIENPGKPFSAYMSETDTLLGILNELKGMEWKNDFQNSRFDSMEVILDNRNKLFISFLRLRSNALNNKEFTNKIDTLSVLLNQQDSLQENNVITTAKKVVTTTLLPDSMVEEETDDRGFLSKIFGKKKKEEIEEKPQPTVKRETVISYDTIALAQRDSTFLEVERMMKSLETDRRIQDTKVQRQELRLIHASGLLLSQLLNILQQVENEEFQQLKENNTAAIDLVNVSVTRINYIFLFFLLLAALLVFLILIDISNANFYKNQLIKEKERAVELSNIKQRFLANMSHEIRTPLQSIIGFAEQLRTKQDQKSPEIKAIYNSSEHLLQIVNEVLDYSRITSGKFTFSKKTFSLKQLMLEVSEAMRIQASKKNLHLEYNEEAIPDIYIESDPFRLRQILYNLIGNAIKFTKEGKVSLMVTLTESEKNIDATFKIRDTGIGMTASELEKIFLNFEQANEKINQDYGGTGLGLSIVKNLVEAQDGKLNVKSTPGKGTEFKVSLQFQKSSKPASANIQTKQLKTSVFDGKILLVDDDQTILLLCANILKKNGIKHEINNNSNEVYNNTPGDFQMALLDIRMPGVNGIELCKKLKSVNPKIRVIALTAHVLEDKTEEITKAGFDGVLKKPFKESELLAVLGVFSKDTAAVNGKRLKKYNHLDLAKIQTLTFGDNELEKLILNQFIIDTNSDINQLRKSLDTEQQCSLREPVHRLSGRTGQLGAIQLSTQLKKIELALERDSADKNVIEPLKKIINKIREMLSEAENHLLEEA